VNDEPNELKRRLEEATARESPRGVPSDDETASLREGWVALGHLMETAQPIDEPFDLRPVAQRTRGSGRVVAIVAALAVSLLIGTITAWLLIGNAPPDGPNVPDGVAAIDDGQERPAEPFPEKPPVQPERVLAVAPPSEEIFVDPLAWDDSFDDQLALLGEDVIRMEEDWYHLDDPFESILDALEQMEEEFRENKL